MSGEILLESDTFNSYVRTYSYDVFGNLKEAVLPGKTITYSVDAHNRRMIRKENGVAVQYDVWNSNNQLIGTMDTNGELQSRFIYGSKSHVPDYMSKNNIDYQIVTNHLGSPVAVVDSSTGVVAQEIVYDVWGNILSDTNPGFTPFGFAGCLYDQDTKLCRFGARDYDANIGRWLSKDPILFNGGDTNLYGYVLNDPINLIDTNGKHPTAIAAIGAGAFSGAIVGAITAYKGSNSCSFKGKARDVAIGAVTGAVGGAISGFGLLSGGLFGSLAGWFGGAATGAGAEAVAIFNNFSGDSDCTCQ